MTAQLIDGVALSKVLRTEAAARAARLRRRESRMGGEDG